MIYFVYLFYTIVKGFYRSKLVSVTSTNMTGENREYKANFIVNIAPATDYLSKTNKLSEKIVIQV